MVREQRAAIYIKDELISVSRGKVSYEQLLQLCRRYCTVRGYQLCKDHIYQADGEPLYSNAPHLIHLRQAAFQGEFDVLIIPSLASIGLLPPWKSIPTSQIIDGFYEYQVRVESAIARYGTHDVYKQTFLEALLFVQRLKDMSERQPGLFGPAQQQEQWPEE
jgi:hypothetical protein